MRRVWVLLAALIAFGLFGGGFLVLPATAATQIQLSSDPFVNASSQHQTQVEPDTFAFGSTIVAAFQSGRCFDGGASDIGRAVPTNGGAGCTPRSLPRP